MGQTLSEPVTEKHTTTVVRDKRYWVGLSDMQGWRISMEDSHSVHLYLPPKSTGGVPDTSIPEQPAGSTVSNNDADQDGNALMCVFDGHGGSTVAKFAGTTLHKRLQALDSYNTGNYEAALKETFLKTDEDLRADPSFFNDPSGCTAVVGLIAEGDFFVANAGDSRCVLGYRGEAKAMSHDHKPTNKEETARITAAGGFIEFGRVNGNLALSRAIGDFEFKQNFSLDAEKQIVTVDPEITSHKLDGEEEFIVLACDGIWDCLSSQQVIDFTRRAIANGDDLGKICENMMTKCLASDSETGGIGCDNMTVVVVALLNGRTPEEWQAWVKERVEKKVGHDTPETIPDVFAHLNTGPGQGFRVGGPGGLSIASILGASGITFRPVEDSDDEDEPATLLDNRAVDGKEKPVDMTNDLADTDILAKESKKGSVQLIDDDGDSHMDSGDESDDTTTGAETPEPQPLPNKPSPVAPSFTSIGSPEVPTHEELQRVSRPSQLPSQPAGDAYPASAKVEGFLDGSESPLKR